MAKKTQEEFIESLIEETNGNYSKQKMQLEKLLEKLYKAVKDGASGEVLGLIRGEISKLEESISKQNEYVSGFYEEMVNLAGGRRDLDSNMLKDVMDFRETFVKMNEKIKDLQESYRNEQQGNNNQAELDRINKEIQSKIDEYEKKYEELKRLYGINSYAMQAADNFMHDVDAQAKVLDNINAKEKNSAVNNQAIGVAIAANNDALKNGSIIWDTIKKTTGEIWSQVKDGGNMWLKFNAQAISDSKRLGFTSKEAARGYTKYLMDSSKELSRNFGMTAEQAMKMQEAFSKATGKASLLSKSQMEDIAASSKLMGDEAVSNAIEMMDNMGSTSQQATELLDKNYARAVNSGLDTVKASDAFVKNMSLANKMSFRNGVDGISKMTIMSQRIKMNLQEVANVAEKFGSIEGAIEGSAQLQMLGGAGAMFGGNPMEMMYEALSDPEALYERMGKMFGEQARFDRKTGEARIDPIQLQIIREQAKAMGMSADEAVQSAKAQAKNKDIEGYASDLVRRYGRNSDELATITNKAQFNKETGQWQITYQDETGETHENVDVKTLTAEQMKDIMKDRIEPIEDIRKRVKQIAIALIGTEERWKSMQDQWKTSKAQAMNGVMETGDTALTDINNSGFWKNIINDGAVGTIGTMIGLGLFKGLKFLAGATIAKGVGNNILTRLGSSSLGRGIGALKGWRPFSNVAGGAGTTANVAPTVTPSASGGGNFGGAWNNVRSSINGARNWGRVGGNAASFSRAGNTVGTLRNMARARNAFKASAKGSAILAGAAEVVGAAIDYHAAGQEAKASKADIEALKQNNRMTSYNFEKRKEEIANREDREKRGAIGQGIGGIGGVAAGAAIGASIGSMVPIPVVGTLAGMAIGAGMGWLGGKIGRAIGESTGKEKGVVEKELDEINDSNEKENLRRIVLPIESIDYNVALIANQLGVISAMASRDNIYLKSEGVGETKVEFTQGLPLEASHVNEVDANTVSQRQSYAGGTVTLNVNGTIELTGGGQGVGKLTAQDIKQIIDNNQELQRHIADVITGRQARNGNAGRNNYENADNRRATISGTYVGGI